MQATSTIAQILSHGQQHKNDATQRVNIAPGSFAAQGDINIWCLPSLDAAKDIQPSDPVYQLAPGTTRGSRHCLDAASISQAKFYQLRSPNTLQGPIWENPNETLVTHPEHGDQVLPPGIYFVTYQRKYAEELKRIQD